jgi:hypothetical protein
MPILPINFQCSSLLASLSLFLYHCTSGLSKWSLALSVLDTGSIPTFLVYACTLACTFKVAPCTSQVRVLNLGLILRTLTIPKARQLPFLSFSPAFQTHQLSTVLLARIIYISGRISLIVLRLQFPSPAATKTSDSITLPTDVGMRTTRIMVVILSLTKKEPTWRWKIRRKVSTSMYALYSLRTDTHCVGGENHKTKRESTENPGARPSPKKLFALRIH